MKPAEMTEGKWCGRKESVRGGGERRQMRREQGGEVREKGRVTEERKATEKREQNGGERGKDKMKR